VVYANQVQTVAKNNAMILPVPHPEVVQLHDLSHYATIFDDCDKCFHHRRDMSKDLELDSFSLQSNETLEVHQCGSYEVSIVPTFHDFHRLNPEYFHLSPAVGEILGKYYSADQFGFLVCKLREGHSQKYHPLAYSHPIDPHTRMFVPTRHHHALIEETSSHYDHEIYSINTQALCGSDEWNFRF